LKNQIESIFSLKTRKFNENNLKKWKKMDENVKVSIKVQ